MQEFNGKTKHALVTGKMLDGKIARPFWAGDAYYHEDPGYFEMFVSLFDAPWYLSANRDSGTYTIFREKLDDGDQLRFRKPIGKAVIADKFNQYLKICVPLWNPRCQPYLSLYPAQ